ncbi:hypothetical protein CHUAL_008147 [Chamberlinius hualienensis]
MSVTFVVVLAVLVFGFQILHAESIQSRKVRRLTTDSQLYTATIAPAVQTSEFVVISEERIVFLGHVYKTAKFAGSFALGAVIVPVIMDKLTLPLMDLSPHSRLVYNEKATTDNSIFQEVDTLFTPSTEF